MALAKDFASCLSWIASISWPSAKSVLPKRTLFVPRPASAQPTKVEMQILRTLWELGPSPVREIHRRLQAAKGTNYSTTVKMLSVMLQKGLVKRDEEAQPHVYWATLTRAKMGKRMIEDLVERVYDGSAMSLVLQALSSGNATKEDLDDIRRILDRMEGE
jgi:BlaI family transcriptional regulator, penicillinase repressor